MSPKILRFCPTMLRHVINYIISTKFTLQVCYIASSTILLFKNKHCSRVTNHAPIVSIDRGHVVNTNPIGIQKVKVALFCNAFNASMQSCAFPDMTEEDYSLHSPLIHHCTGTLFQGYTTALRSKVLGAVKIN